MDNNRNRLQVVIPDEIYNYFKKLSHDLSARSYKVGDGKCFNVSVALIVKALYYCYSNSKNVPPESISKGFSEYIITGSMFSSGTKQAIYFKSNDSFSEKDEVLTFIKSLYGEKTNPEYLLSKFFRYLCVRFYDEKEMCNEVFKIILKIKKGETDVK